MDFAASGKIAPKMELPLESFPDYEIEYTQDQKPYIRLPHYDNTTLLFLTEFYETDAEALMETLNVEDINNALISVPKPYKLDHAHYFINLQLHSPGAVPFLQVIRSGDPRLGRLAGCVSLTPREGATENLYELGYYLHPEFQKKGAMKRIVGTVIRYGFQEKGVHCVEVKIREDNLSSRKIIESIPQFKRAEGTVETVEWPVVKGGGGSKTLLAWRIVAPDSALP
ncbi:hypothetical protein BP6252_11279 [Coleophoma cylindrospora]|uniref:N-acetyltransferase domain-containing protein n=1 Tax=Coleophoma cylindrospora TaxID=1849047 RepID=A0A3D8QQH7_9HELO|nr:hypothetical protein BP6252_11279 [Coleophoma cylindrospora]